MDKEYLIKDIEALTLEEVEAMDHIKIEINGHDVYMVDFKGYFGFSALVFRAGHHLYYANDYELHHKGKSREEIKKLYEDTLPNKLYSDEMIAAPIKDYHDGENKDYYLYNYYPQMCSDKVSAFNIFHNDTERAAFEKKIKDMYYSKIGFFYTRDKTFIDRLNELYQIAQKSKKGSLDNYDYWLDAFKYEMFNHEYAISWEPDTSTLSAFGLPYEVGYQYENNDYSKGLDYLFDALKFSDMQRKAYRDARSYVLNHSNY